MSGEALLRARIRGNFYRYGANALTAEGSPGEAFRTCLDTCDLGGFRQVNPLLRA